MRASVLAILATALLATSTFAQPPGASPTNVPLAQPPPNQTPAQRVKLRLRAIRASELVTELNLSPQIAGRMTAIMDRYDVEFDRLSAQRADLQRKLNDADLIRDPNAIEKLIDDAVANQRYFWDAEDHRLAELRKIFTPQQTARLLVVLPQLERRLQNQLQKAIRAGGQKRRQNRSRPPGDDDDDD